MYTENLKTSEQINKRQEKGHWEMDLVVGKGRFCLQVMTERVTRKELIFKIPDKKQESIKKNIDMLEMKYKDEFKQITIYRCA